MKKTIDDGNASAQKMTRHDEADKQYTASVARYRQTVHSFTLKH